MSAREPIVPAVQQQTMAEATPAGAVHDINDPFAVFDHVTTLTIKQNLNVVTGASGWIQNNSYRVLNQHGHEVMFAVEASGTCARQWALPNMRGFQMSVGLGNAQMSLPVLNISRAFSCSCCCLGRPEILINDARTGVRVGRVDNPCRCCDVEMGVYDARDQRIFQVDGAGCQKGLLCHCLSDIEFTVRDAATGEMAATISNQFSAKSLLVQNTDNYHIVFGMTRNPMHKALILAVAMFLDSRYFNIQTL